MDPESDYLHGILPGTTSRVDPGSAWPIAGDAGVALGYGSGQYGIAPIATQGSSEGSSSMGNPFTAIWTWLNKPFQTPLSVADIGLIVGAIIVAILFWNFILYHLRGAAEAI
jgi:hypothetical protein